MSDKRLGLVTIGQAPRVDVTPDIITALDGVELVEAGALDELTPAEIACLAPEPGEPLLVSRLRNGQLVALSEMRMHAYVQAAVNRLEHQGINAVLIICTGKLPGVQATVPIYTAEALSRGGVLSLIGEATLGVVIPEQEQVASVRAGWTEQLGREPVIEDCNPYSASLDDFVKVAEKFAETQVEWVFMDCIGYSEEMADAIRTHTGVRVLTARSVAARLALIALTG